MQNEIFFIAAMKPIGQEKMKPTPTRCFSSFTVATTQQGKAGLLGQDLKEQVHWSYFKTCCILSNSKASSPSHTLRRSMDSKWTGEGQQVFPGQQARHFKWMLMMVLFMQ